MNRRDFLKLGAALGLTITIPAVIAEEGLSLARMRAAVAVMKERAIQPTADGDYVVLFNKEREYGRSIDWWGTGATEEFKLQTEALLIEDARAELPKGVLFEIRDKVPTNYGLDHGMAWYYNPHLKARPRGLNLDAGYYSRGTHIA